MNKLQIASLMTVFVMASAEPEGIAYWVIMGCALVSLGVSTAVVNGRKKGGRIISAPTKCKSHKRQEGKKVC